jgi:GT2 family glycosyltransferase
MSAAVLDIDLNKMPSIIEGLEGYLQAFVLIRVGVRPVGQIWVPIEDERLSGADILDHIKRSRDRLLWHQIVVNNFLQGNVVEHPSKLPTATVVVVTRDRPRELRRCLNALLALPDDGQEYLVIDNCPSTDETKRLVAGHGDRVRYIREDRLGASAARNRALREAKTEIVAFTDDDAFPDPGWLRALLGNFNDPLVLCATGLVLPFELETDAQCGFERYSPHGRGFTRIVYDSLHYDALNVGPVGVSASMALHKSILELVGGFEETLSPGTPARAGEDYELFSRILRSGYRIVYDPAAISWHRHRRSWQELRQAIFGYGIAVYAQWTHTFFVEHEFTIPRLALAWFGYKQLPNLIRSLLRKPDCFPLDLLLAELTGCAVGPFAYLRSRRRLGSLKGNAS